MGNSPSSKDKNNVSFSERDAEKAFAALQKSASQGNVMACYDVGFMMIQGIGCRKNRKEGFEMMKRGSEFERNEKDLSWKSENSVTKLIGPQKLLLMRLFWMDFHSFILGMGFFYSPSVFVTVKVLSNWNWVKLEKLGIM